MNDWLLIVLAILAAYRVAHMLALEEGPLSIFAEIRARLDPEQKTWLGRGVSCPLCIGFWVAGAIALVLIPAANWQGLLLNWLAIAGGQTVLYLWLEQ